MLRPASLGYHSDDSVIGSGKRCFVGAAARGVFPMRQNLVQ